MIAKSVLEGVEHPIGVNEARRSLGDMIEDGGCHTCYCSRQGRGSFGTVGQQTAGAILRFRKVCPALPGCIRDIFGTKHVD